MKAMEYCDGCKLARMAVDCYQRESHEFCGVFCMATGQMHFATDSCPCGQLVHAGEGHMEGDASERRVDG